MTMLTEKAAAFAAKAHAKQQRKYTGAPYFTHVKAVAEAVAAQGADEATIAAAFLHDTVEDTPVTVAELEAEFGPEIAGLVFELTDQFTHEAFPHLNRAKRKALETERLAKASPRAKAIKRADMADNTASIMQHDPNGFGRVYMAEKAALMEVL